MTFISVLFIAGAYIVFLFGCTRLMACIRGKQLSCPFDEWKGSLFAFIVSVILLLGCVIGSWRTTIRCPQCNAIAIQYHCRNCDIDIAQNDTVCPSCNTKITYGFCATCGILLD